MKLIPSPATKVIFEGGRLKAEWSDLSLDDEDRYTGATVMLYADVGAESADDEVAITLLHDRLRNEFDRWVKETRA